jgi:A/G-specific adenine glycosylase
MSTFGFRQIIHARGKELYRGMAWRVDTRPYYILVSEIMLQQTQVARVEVKFAEFIDRFPDIQSLAAAPLGDVLKLWSGLGYNRRAKFLWQAARMVMNDFDGDIPSTKHDLVKLPGVGENTAGALLAYAFNQPVVFVETNIRTVYIHHFFADRSDVSDKEICKLVAETLDAKHPREWYWALMDYGVWLKSQKLGRITRSKHYTKQSKLSGSLREMRGHILKALAEDHLSTKKLKVAVQADERFQPALDSLSAEGLIEKTSQSWHLPN